MEISVIVEIPEMRSVHQEMETVGVSHALTVSNTVNLTYDFDVKFHATKYGVY